MNTANSANYAEYTVTQKSEGKYLKRKLLLIALYVAVVIAYLCGVVALSTYGVLVVILTLPFIPLAVMVVRHLLWNRYVIVEHKYEIESAKIIFTEIYGHTKEEIVYEKLVSAFSLIAPVTEEYKDKYEGADVYLDFRSTVKSPDSYFLLLEEDGKKTVIYFEAITKALKIMSFYNSQNTVMSNTLRI